MEDKTETGPNYEQRRWEEEHLHAALLKFGAKDAKSASKVLAHRLSSILLSSEQSRRLYTTVRQHKLNLL